MPKQPRLIGGLGAPLRGMFAALTGALLRPDTRNREPDMELQPSGDQGDSDNDADADAEETDRLGEDFLLGINPSPF